MSPMSVAKAARELAVVVALGAAPWSMAPVLLTAPPESAPAASSQNNGAPGEAQPAEAVPEPPVEPATLLPLEAREDLFKVIEGEGTGEQIRQQLVESEEGVYVLTFGDRNRLFLTKDADGALVIARLELLDENKGVAYDPAVPLLPASIRPGRAYEYASQARVYDLETREVTHSGTARHRINEIARGQFDTDIGQTRGYLVTLDHRVNLPLATVTIDLEVGYEPGYGIVYRRMRSNVQKLGLFGESATRSAVISRRDTGEPDVQEVP